uniref:Uncharacterized protein n=1 Tax=Bionectria ochroleuca TaxID=29856 RepID=A0A0B7K1Q9_BIOOC
MDSPTHMRIHPQCGACGRPFEEGANIVALTYHNSICVALNPGSYSSSGYYEQVNSDYIFCQYSDVPSWRPTSEAMDCSYLEASLATFPATSATFTPRG